MWHNITLMLLWCIIISLNHNDSFSFHQIIAQSSTICSREKTTLTYVSYWLSISSCNFIESYPLVWSQPTATFDMADGKGAEGTAVTEPAAVLRWRDCVLQEYYESHGAASRGVPVLLVSTSKATARKVPLFPEGASVSKPRSQSTWRGTWSCQDPGIEQMKNLTLHTGSQVFSGLHRILQEILPTFCNHRQTAECPEQHSGDISAHLFGSSPSQAGHWCQQWSCQRTHQNDCGTRNCKSLQTIAL